MATIRWEAGNLPCVLIKGIRGGSDVVADAHAVRTHLAIHWAQGSRLERPALLWSTWTPPRWWSEA